MVKLASYFLLPMALCCCQTVTCQKTVTVKKNNDPKRNIAKRNIDLSVLTLPDFSIYRDIKAKKSAFFAFIAPLARESNRIILQQRSRIERIKLTQQISNDDVQFISKLAKKYKIPHQAKNFDLIIDELLERVDEIPLSLVLAQAANESAWGTSRFATEANNLFGIWCFRAGCGLVPQARKKGMSHEVRKFASVWASVRAYMHNLNTQSSYQELRKKRNLARLRGERIGGLKLCDTLVKYSSRGHDYTRELQQMIRANKLEYNWY